MRALLIFMAILGLMAVGCAGSDEKAAAGGAPLTPEQYEELERLNRAQFPVDRLQEEGKDRKAVEVLAAACAEVPAGDRLLDTVIEVCDEWVDTLSLMLTVEREGCGNGNCAQVVRELTATVDLLIAASRRGDEEVREVVSHERCRQALVTRPKTYEALGLMREGLGHYDDALRTGRQAAIRKGTSKIEEGAAMSEDGPSARQRLERFRTACSD